ncbi:MAG: hypothetical protein H7338_23860 [Candidatus Sericytochromatia bacterium]|nr:hypothetical protein [Candidatus Sericytochromatia bacterium]
MAVVMSGQYAYWLNFYNRTQKAVELVSNDLNSTVARAGIDRGQYVRDEAAAGGNGKPMFIATDRTDPNNPVYSLTDVGGKQAANYSIDANGNILYAPQTEAIQGGWFSGNHVGASRTVNFATDSYMWHRQLPVADEQVYFGRSFLLDQVDPASSTFQRGGTIYLAVDSEARVYVNGTFIGECYGASPPTELIIPPNLLKTGENVISVQANNRAGGAGAAGFSMVADVGGIDGRGGGFGGVTLTTRATETDRWSASKGNVSGLVGKVAFEVRQGSALTSRTEQVSRMGAVLQTLSGMLGAAAEQDQTKFRALR